MGYWRTTGAFAKLTVYLTEEIFQTLSSLSLLPIFGSKQPAVNLSAVLKIWEIRVLGGYNFSRQCYRQNTETLLFISRSDTDCPNTDSPTTAIANNGKLLQIAKKTQEK